MKTLFICSIIACSICACSHRDASSAIDDINTAVAAGDMPLARQMCAQLIEADSTLSASQLMQLAVAYMSIADDADDLQDMASAAKCYNMAFVADPDSAQAFIAQMSPAQQSQLRLLTDVSFGVDDFDILQDSEEGLDSLDNPSNP